MALRGTKAAAGREARRSRIKPESTDGFVGSAFGAGWPLGWCVCAGRRVLGRAGLECGAGAVGGGWGSAALRRALSGGSDEQGQAADVSQGGGEGVCPWPVERQAQGGLNRSKQHRPVEESVGVRRGLRWGSSSREPFAVGC